MTNAIGFNYIPAPQPFSGQVVVGLQTNASVGGWQVLTTFNIQPLFEGLWDTSRPAVTDQLKNEIGKGGRWDGQTAYDINISLSARGQLYAQVGGVAFIIRYVLQNNSVRAKMTQPTIFGSSLDPAFEIDFDLHVILNLSGGSALADAIQVESVEGEFQNSRIRGTNLIGTVAGAIAGLGKFENAINGQTFALDINTSLGQVVPAGYVFTPFTKPGDQALYLLAEKPAPPPPALIP
jgi:hypothetical protein